MPTARRAPRRSRRDHAPDSIPQSDTAISREEVEQATSSLPGREGFDPFLEEQDGGVPFFSMLQMMSSEEWQRTRLYLYRLDPKIKSTDDYKYIQKYDKSIDEDDIKAEWGGGKYELWLKDMVDRGQQPRVRRYRFSIEGAAVIGNGQTLVGDAGAAAAASARDNSESGALARALPEIMRTISADKRGDADGANQVVEAMGAGMKNVLTVVTETMKQSVTSITGTAAGDKLLEMLMTRLNGDNTPKRSSALEEKLIGIALARLENPQPAAETGELAVIKDLLGTDNILDLVRGAKSGPGDAWKTKLVDMGASLLGNLPAIIGAIGAMQERQFQRQIQLQAVQKNGAVVLPPNTPVPPAAPEPGAPSVIPAAMPDFVTPVAPGATRQQDPATMALEDIVFQFHAGLGGDAAASFVKTKYPDFVTVFKPLLSDRSQVGIFCQNTPPLSTIAGDEDFAEFLDEFIQEAVKEDPEGPELVQSSSAS